MGETTKTIVLTAFALTALIAFLSVGTSCYLWAVGKDIPAGLGVLVTATVTYVYTTLPTMVKTFTDKGI